MPVYFGMSFSYTVNDVGAKSVVIKTLGYENKHVTVTLAVLTDGSKVPPYVILNHKTMPKAQLPREIIVRCQMLMTNEHMKDSLLVV